MSVSNTGMLMGYLFIGECPEKLGKIGYPKRIKIYVCGIIMRTSLPDITCKEYGKIEFFPVTDELETSDLHLQAHGLFGSITIKHMECDEYSIWICECRIEKDITVLFHQPDYPILGLTFSLRSTIQFHLHGLPQRICKKYQYGLFYTPYVKCEYTLSKGNYELWGIEFSMKFIEKWVAAFPFLGDYINKYKNGSQPIMIENFPSASVQMLDVIHDIRQCHYSGELRKTYLDVKVPDLLLFSLERITFQQVKTGNIRLKEEDKEKILKASEYLINNIENPGTLLELAQRVGTNDFKLKRGFLQLFGTSAFAFLLEHRMQKSKQLILKTDTPIKVIARMVGYANLTGFTKAFKKRFGMPPIDMKMKIML